MEVRCTQCGAELEVAADARLIECSFCTTTLVVDAEGVLFHEVLLPTVEAAAVPAHLRRFLASDVTVAGLDREARIGEPSLQYFPFWAFTIHTGQGEQVILEPAAPSSLQGLQGLELPAGTTVRMDREVTGDAPVIEPEVPVTTAREWLHGRLGEVTVRRTVLYHLPMYRVAYSWKGTTYQAAVEGASGKVLPAEYPAKAEAPYVIVAAIAMIVFAVEGLIVENLVIKAALYVLSALPLLGLAWLTSRKV